MYPYGWDAAIWVMVVIMAAPILVLGVIAWLLVKFGQPPEDTGRRIARERFARGEIDEGELRILLQAL